MRSTSGGRWLAEKLERGAIDGAMGRSLARLWANRAEPARPLVLPAGVRVVGIGGATLGGSGKTTLCAELAQRLCAAGLRVSVVATGYGARVATPRRVELADRVEAVSDEALLLARRLCSTGVAVFVASRRGAALELAARAGSELVIVDGLLQARPERLALSILALDGAAPWGSELCPPAGDLRAHPQRLCSAADVIAVHGAASALVVPGAPIPVLSWSTRLVGARSGAGELVPLSVFGAQKVGVVLALARPERVLAELREHAIAPEVVRLCGDHARPSADRRWPERPVDAWLTTAKCATKLGSAFAGAPVFVLEQAARVPTALVEMCAGLAPASPGSGSGILGPAP